MFHLAGTMLNNKWLEQVYLFKHHTLLVKTTTVCSSY